MAFASPAAYDAIASSTATSSLIFSASLVSFSTILAFFSVSLLVSIRIGYNSSSSLYILDTFDSVVMRQSYPC